jgi:hypothetical protein
MAKSATDIVPEEFFDVQHAGAVIDFLKAFPIPGQEKLDIFIAWAKAVGVKTSGSQRDAVKASGTDNLVGF